MTDPTDPPKRPLTEWTPEEILNRDMSQAAWGPKLGRGGKKDLRASIRSKNDPAQLAQLAAVRDATKIGGPRMRQCKAFSKKRNDRCPNPALKGEHVCRMHMDKATRTRLIARRRAEGRPIDKAHVLARRNVKTLWRQQRIPYDLMREPVFQAAMRLVAPRWFGIDPNAIEPFDQARMGRAALLAREMVLAWINATASGDWAPWHAAVAKVYALGLKIPERGPSY